MKNRQSKTGTYHSLRVRIPQELWVDVKETAEREHKSYSLLIVEALKSNLRTSHQVEVLLDTFTSPEEKAIKLGVSTKWISEQLTRICDGMFRLETDLDS